LLQHTGCSCKLDEGQGIFILPQIVRQKN